MLPVFEAIDRYHSCVTLLQSAIHLISSTRHDQSHALSALIELLSQLQQFARVMSSKSDNRIRSLPDFLSCCQQLRSRLHNFYRYMEHHLHMLLFPESSSPPPTRPTSFVDHCIEWITPHIDHRIEQWVDLLDSISESSTSESHAKEPSPPSTSTTFDDISMDLIFDWISAHFVLCEEGQSPWQSRHPDRVLCSHDNYSVSSLRYLDIPRVELVTTKLDAYLPSIRAALSKQLHQFVRQHRQNQQDDDLSIAVVRCIRLISLKLFIGDTLEHVALCAVGLNLLQVVFSGSLFDFDQLTQWYQQLPPLYYSADSDLIQALCDELVNESQLVRKLRLISLIICVVLMTL